MNKSERWIKELAAASLLVEKGASAFEACLKALSLETLVELNVALMRQLDR